MFDIDHSIRPAIGTAPIPDKAKMLRLLQIHYRQRVRGSFDHLVFRLLRMGYTHDDLRGTCIDSGMSSWLDDAFARLNRK